MWTALALQLPLNAVVVLLLLKLINQRTHGGLFRTLRNCHLCPGKTQYRCSGCRRYLCMEAPKKGKDRDGNKYPSEFTVKVPVLEADGSVKRDASGKPVFEVDHGVLSCWHIVHSAKWKNMYRNGMKLNPVSAEDASKKK